MTTPCGRVYCDLCQQIITDTMPAVHTRAGHDLHMECVFAWGRQHDA